MVSSPARPQPSAARCLATAVLAAWVAASAAAIDCTGTTVGVTPLSDLGDELYLGQFQGGLYPDGANMPPPEHWLAGRGRAFAITPLGATGQPDPNGSYVLLSIGMSNTTQEFCSGNGALPCTPWSFMGQAAADPRVDATGLRIANGALGLQVASTWDAPDDPNYDRVRDTVLAPQGLAEPQVVAAWVKLANPTPTFSLPAANADARRLFGQLGDVVRALKVRYPNLVLVFLSTRVYAGYADTALNPEPFAYEAGFGAKWLIEAQIDQMAGAPPDPTAGDLDYGSLPAIAPWVGWGPYLWADGTTPRSDGLTWSCSDFQNDGTHPSMAGQQKVGAELLRFFLGSPFAQPWFVAGHVFADGFESGSTADWIVGP
jgi:hypothetical protein